MGFEFSPESKQLIEIGKQLNKEGQLSENNYDLMRGLVTDFTGKLGKEAADKEQKLGKTLDKEGMEREAKRSTEEKGKEVWGSSKLVASSTDLLKKSERDLASSLQSLQQDEKNLSHNDVNDLLILAKMNTVMTKMMDISQAKLTGKSQEEIDKVANKGQDQSPKAQISNTVNKAVDAIGQVLLAGLPQANNEAEFLGKEEKQRPKDPLQAMKDKLKERSATAEASAISNQALPITAQAKEQKARANEAFTSNNTLPKL